MDHSAGSCIDPEQLIQLPNNCAPEPFQPQPVPMGLMGGSMGCEIATNGMSPCLSQDSPAGSAYGVDSDIPRYLMPIDFQCQPTIQNRRFGGSDNNDAAFKLENERRLIAHSRRSSRSSNKLTSDESGVDKRERNRMAASKCRKKQKLANNELQERARIMEQHHNYLMAHKASLESETLNLKNQLLLHGGCDSEPISTYLMQAAKKFAQGQEEDVRSAERTEHWCEKLSSTGSEPSAL
ncbi:hypothetical protein F5Y04DRAFT_291900 [Hypomontagnella monticulosa]|nr:hypothetical protein F5Y04DRAFT_291900 [Hypomontagnella monticulosa]